MAWGSLWAERDPELYIGAMIYSLLLQPLVADTEQKLADIKTKLLMRVGMGERNAILSAKVYADYVDILGKERKVKIPQRPETSYRRANAGPS